MKLSFFINARDVSPRTADLTWEQLVERLSSFRTGDKDGPAWSPAEIEGTRADRNVLAITLFVADLDHVTDEQLAAIDLSGYAYALHSTFTPGSYRLIMPVSRPILPAEWLAVREEICRRFNLPADPKTANLSRIYYLPTVRNGASPVFDSQPGAAIEVSNGNEAKRTLGPYGEREIGLHVDPRRAGDDETPRGDSEHDSRSDGSLDVGAARTRLASVARGKSDAARAVGKALKGEALSEVGGHDDALNKVCSAVAFTTGLPYEAALSILRPSFVATGWQDGLEHMIEEGRKKYERALARKKESEARSAEIDVALARLVEVPEPTPIDLKEKPRLTDAGNAERLAEAYSDHVRFVPQWGKWVVWDKARWRVDESGLVKQFAIRAAREFGVAAYKHIPDDEEYRKLVVGFALKSENAKAIENTLALAKTIPRLVMHSDRMDTDPFRLNVSNGTINLRTGELEPPNREHLITKLAPVEHDPAAACPVFERMLERVLPDAELREFVQRAVGYALTGCVDEQSLMFLHGLGANGKSTVVEILQRVLGDYACQGSPDLLVQNPNGVAPWSLATLQGRRFVVCSETEQGSSFSEVTVKQLTGSDRIRAAFKHGHPFEFSPSHKIWISGNHKPRIRGTDEGIWRRVRLVPFEVTIPEPERDKNIKEKISLAGVLAWAVRGCLAWQRDGLGEPAKVTEGTKEYREEQDTIGQFLSEAIVGRDLWTSSSTIYQKYKEWSIMRGERVWTMNAFSRALTEHGVEKALGGPKGKDRGWSIEFKGGAMPSVQNLQIPEMKS